ncbi:acetyl-CoA carboxylase biotin carboxylase subunit, partial [Thermobifida halotolerans]|uniref:acetyl-CoA carboxylase biotin carboxylase subunit n=1 Tax=Thermobifida halotolerans TaxID=483545 RepID=UPI001F27FA79
MTIPFPPTAPGAHTVLVANRGEIAVRIIRTLRRLALRAVAVYSDADADARHVRAADTALRVGDYLDADAIVGAALESGATMVHPGYGFLAENAAFARACAAAGLVFVGPPPEAIEAMGDKIRAKRTVADAGVPLLPGFAETPGQPMSDADLTAAADRVGYPLLLKPSAGGGGKGMRLVRRSSELAEAAAAARREARSAFGDATLLAERFVERPRHIEVQILADAHGNVVHLGERECSLQRRHQKIVEESPSPLLTPDRRAAMGRAAVAAARACGYVGAGTVEFIAAPAAGDGYFFLEMNTRLQVEHPVTEAVATIRGERGIDLVEAQLRVALGEALPFTQDDVALTGHAVECRIYAEDPARGFLPTGGRVLLLDEPDSPGVRVDSGIAEGADVTSAYDPMLAKVVVWDTDRAGALRRADAALARYTLLGCGVNTAFLRALLAHPEVVAGNLSTELTERLRPELTARSRRTPEEVLAAAALDRQLGLRPPEAPATRFAAADGWRVGEPAWTVWRLHPAGGDAVTVRVRAERGSSDRFRVRVGEGGPVSATAVRSA